MRDWRLHAGFLALALSGCVARSELDVAYRLTLTAGAPSAAADGQSTIPLIVTATDSTGAPVVNLASLLEITAGQGTLQQAGLTDQHGVATGTISSTVVGNVTIRVVLIGVNVPNSNQELSVITVAFTAPPSNAAVLSVSASPISITAGTRTTLTVSLRSTAGTPIGDESVAMACSDSTAVITPMSGVTSPQGTFTATLVTTHTGTPTITATADHTTAQTVITVTPAAASQALSTVTLNPNVVAADGATSGLLTGAVRDIYGNPIPGYSGTFTFDGNATTFQPSASVTTDANGQFTRQVVSTVAQSENIVFSGTGLAFSLPINFSAGAPSQAQSSFKVVPVALTVGGTATMTFTVADTQGNLLSGYAVSITATGPSNVGLPANGNTNASGVFLASLNSNVAGLRAVTATAGAVVFNTNVTFVPGAPTNLIFIANPNSITANGTQKSTLTLQANDTFGNPVPNQNTTITGGNAGTTGLPANGNTNAAGQFVVTNLATTQAGNIVVTATVGALNANLTVVAIAAQPAQFAVTLTTADPTQGTYLSFGVQAEDALGNLTPSYTGIVTLSSNDTTASPNATHAVYTFTASDNGAHTFPAAIQFALQENTTVTAQDTNGLQGHTTVAVAPFYAQTLGFESLAVPATCLQVPGLNNAVGQTLSTNTCAFHADDVFYLGNDNSLRVMGMCVEVPNANYAAATAVALNACNGSAQQQWTLGNGTALQALGNSAYCLDTSALPTVEINLCSTATTQQWVLHSISNTVTLWNAASGFVVDVSGGAFITGQRLDSYPFNDTRAQHFELFPDGTLRTGTNNNAINPICAEVRAANFSSGAVVDIHQCGPAPQDLWVLAGNTLRPRMAQNLCVTLSAAQAANLTVATCSGAANQAITLQSASLHQRFVQEGNTSLCLTINGGDVAGTGILTGQCAHNYQQYFKQAASSALAVNLQFPEGGTIADAGTFPITPGTPVTMQNPATDPCSDVWAPQLYGDAFAYLAQAQNTLAMDANGTTGATALITSAYTTGAPTPTQLFYVWPVAMPWELSSATTQCITPAVVPPIPGTALQIAPCTGTPAQAFTWMPDATMQLNGLCVDMLGETNAVGSTVILNTCDWSQRQQWNNNGNLSGNVVLFDQNVTNTCLDTNGTTATGQPLTLQTCSPASSQRFIFQ